MSKKIKPDTWTVYVHFANRTFIVGHYKTTKPELARELAARDLADMLKMSVFIPAAHEGRPYLAAFLDDLEKSGGKDGQNEN